MSKQVFLIETDLDAVKLIEYIRKLDKTAEIERTHTKTLKEYNFQKEYDQHMAAG
jgi:hypothetical protein